MTENYEETLKTAEYFFNSGSYILAMNTLTKIQNADRETTNKKFTMLLNILKEFRKIKDYQSSLKCLLEMEKTTPDNEQVLVNIALTYEHFQNVDSASAYYEKILSKNKRNYDALIHTAILLIYQHDLKNASGYIERAKRAKPNQFKTAYAYYKLYEEEAKHKEAMRYAKEMVMLNPDDIDGYYFCANSSYQIFDYKKSIEYCDKYLTMNPDNADIQCLKILCMKKSGMIDNIIPLFEDLLQKYPKEFTLKKLYLMQLLTAKNYDEAMKYYLDVVSNAKVDKYLKGCEAKFLEYEKKSWRREDLTGKTILVYQGPFGLGDYLMFSRYIPLLEQMAGKVIIEANHTYFDLFKYNFKNIEIIPDTNEAIDFEKYDYSVSSMEMIYGMNMNFDNIPNSQGWFKIPEEKIEKVKNDSKFNTEKHKIGLFWRGSGGLMKHRNIELDKLVSLFELDNCQFYSIDIEEKDKNILDIFEKYNIIDCSDYINSAEDTGALLKNLDVFISVDSFPLHLAGSLGVKTYLILPVLAEWRWFNDTKNTPWYDFVKIFRQTETENLDFVVNNIKNQLSAL